MARDYPTLMTSLRADGDRPRRMQMFVDAMWPPLSANGVSWLGFYLIAESGASGREMVLGARRDKPACSPIGMHGACGRCFMSGRPLIVRDVAALGAGYIACDPRDRSEVVLPLFEPGGDAWGVLDLDSYDTGSFDQGDVDGLQAALERAGLTTRQDWRGRTDVV